MAIREAEQAHGSTWKLAREARGRVREMLTARGGKWSACSRGKNFMRRVGVRVM